MQICEGRLQRIPIVDDDNSQNLKTAFAVTVLRYSLHCLNSVYEWLAVFKVFVLSELRSAHKREGV